MVGRRLPSVMPELIKPEPHAPPELPAETSAILRIFGRNTVWLWLDLGAIRIGTALAGLFLIRYFGPTNFGIYSMALAVGWVANAFIDLGLTRYAARAVAATPEKVCGILALNLFSTVLSALLTAAGLLIALKLGHWRTACLAAGFIVCNFDGTANLCSNILTAQLRSRAILPGSLLGAGGLVAFIFAAIMFHLSVLSVLLLLSGRSIAVLGLRLWQLRRYWPGVGEWTVRRFREVAGCALPYFANTLTQVGYAKIAILCLGFLATEESVGWFAAAFALSDVIPQWSYSLSGAILPVWTRLFETNRIEVMLELRQRLMDVILFASIPIWISMALFAPQICSLLGQKYIPSADILRILALRCVFSVFDGFLGHGFLVAVDRVKERQSALARCAALLIGLSLLFGYLWGARGVALALLTSDSCLILQYLKISSRIRLKVHPPPSFAPIFFAGACMALTTFLLPAGTDIIPKLLFAFLSYFGVLVVLSRKQLLSAGKTVIECLS